MPVAVITLAVDLGSWFLPVPEPWVQGTSLLSLLLFLVVVLGQTLRRGPVTFHRIQGAVAAYLLLGILWAHAYALVAHLRPGAFSGPVNPADGPRAFFYFSFVTLTTVGYGDVLPVHPAARSLAMLEAVDRVRSTSRSWSPGWSRRPWRPIRSRSRRPGAARCGQGFAAPGSSVSNSSRRRVGGASGPSVLRQNERELRLAA